MKLLTAKNSPVSTLFTAAVSGNAKFFVPQQTALTASDGGNASPVRRVLLAPCANGTSGGLSSRATPTVRHLLRRVNLARSPVDALISSPSSPAMVSSLVTALQNVPGASTLEIPTTGPLWSATSTSARPGTLCATAAARFPLSTTTTARGLSSTGQSLLVSLLYLRLLPVLLLLLTTTPA